MIDARSFFIGVFFCLITGVLAAVAVGVFFPSLDFSAPSPLSSGPAIIPSLSPSTNSVQSLFSPGSGDDIVSLIRGAQKSIDVEMYVFTDPALARELSDAASRGVNVRVILEPRVTASNLDAIASALQAGGVQVRWASTTFQLTHAKMMVVDGKVVLVGSINFSRAAQGKNREAAAVLAGPVVNDYENIFEKDWAISLAVRGMTAPMGGEAG